MKKILRLVALSLLLMQTQFVFAKCTITYFYQRYSNAYQSQTFGFTTDTALFQLVPGDTIKIMHQWTGYSDMCNCFVNSFWYANSYLVQTNSEPYVISSPGNYAIRLCSMSNPLKSIIVSSSSATAISTLTSAPLPFPFSNSSINTTNLRYKILNTLGEKIEEGKFSGEIILRSGNHSLSPGIYFVIYSDALDNRQVITDKVFVNAQ